MKGTISDIALETNTGTILGENGSNYTFHILDWKEPQTPAKGDNIYFIGTNASTATDIYIDKTNNSLAQNIPNTTPTNTTSTSPYGYSKEPPSKVSDVYASPIQHIMTDDEAHWDEDNYSIIDWFMKGMRNYVNFSGRARRKEYWYFTLVKYAIFLIALALDLILFSSEGVFSSLSYFALLLPSISVTVRRLHDIDRSGWHWFVLIIPFGILFMLYWTILDTDPARNQWGPPAK